jgi:Flp pilus assembly pilin Flp
MVLSRKLGDSVPLFDRFSRRFSTQIREIVMSGLLARLWYDEEGQDLTETALLMVLLALVVIASTRVVGQIVSNIFSNAATDHAST